MIEPNASGHRLHLAGLVAEGLVEGGHEVCLATSLEATSSDAYAQFVEPLTVDLEIEPSAPSSLTAAPSRTAWDWAMETIAQRGFDHVYVPDGDRLTQFATWWPSARKSVSASGAAFHVLLLRNWYAYPSSGPREVARSRMSRFAARRNPWNVTHFLDPLAVERSPWIGSSDRERVLVPEPVKATDSVSAVDARRYFDLDPGLPTIVMPGSADERKGADLLVESFLARGGGDGQLFLAGRISPGVADLLTKVAERPGAARVVALDRFLSEWEFWAALQAADVVAVPYPHHVGSSGILARAAHLSKPVVASDFGWIGEATRRYGLGAVVDVGNTEALADATTAALEGAYAVDPQRSKSFVEFNTPESFKRVWSGGVS